jgi:hypothetical protein
MRHRLLLCWEQACSSGALCCAAVVVGVRGLEKVRIVHRTIGNRGGGGGGGWKKEFLTKLSRIPSSVENILKKTNKNTGFTHLQIVGTPD